VGEGVGVSVGGTRVLVGVGVLVGGTEVSVAVGVLVGGTGVFVGAGVLVGLGGEVDVGIEVDVGLDVGWGVNVGSSGVAVGTGVAVGDGEKGTVGVFVAVGVVITTRVAVDVGSMMGGSAGGEGAVGVGMRGDSLSGYVAVSPPSLSPSVSAISPSPGDGPTNIMSGNTISAPRAAYVTQTTKLKPTRIRIFPRLIIHTSPGWLGRPNQTTCIM
jgi:hypothetical protein